MAPAKKVQPKDAPKEVKAAEGKQADSVKAKDTSKKARGPNSGVADDTI